MKAHLLCPSQHLDVCEIDVETTCTIKGVGFERVGINQEEKGVIYFDEFRKALVVNRITLSRLTRLFGDETDDWFGEQIILYPSQTLVNDGDRIVPCVRIKGINGEAFPE